eukprot:891877-Pleurochrysis_carterae.AAC.3
MKFEAPWMPAAHKSQVGHVYKEGAHNAARKRQDPAHDAAISDGDEPTVWKMSQRFRHQPGGGMSSATEVATK